ncbi:hypothetical protein JR041_26630, partial [Pseudomonas mosselii]|nr:hypothetical protein [Pseudomonas mosselii]
MPAVDLSQLPEPAIIAEPDFEAILADTKAMMIASYPAEQREAVSAALELESEPLNVIAQTMSFREMLLRQRVNEGARACMLSHSAGTDLDNLAGNMNTKRLVITPATDTTDDGVYNPTTTGWDDTDKLDVTLTNGSKWVGAAQSSVEAIGTAQMYG